MQSILRLSEILTIELQIPVFTDIEKRHREIEKSPEAHIEPENIPKYPK